MMKSNSLKDQKLVDKKIEAFCESSARLLETIHARYGNKAEAGSLGRSRKEKGHITRKRASISDLAVDFGDEETLDSSY